MGTKVGVGKSIEPEPAEAGAQAAREALKAAGVERADLVLVGATMGYDHATLLSGIRSVTKDALLVGCTAAGVIDESGPDEGLRRVEVLVMTSDRMTFTPAIVQGVEEDSYHAGQELTAQLTKSWPEQPQFLLLIADGLKTNPDKLFAGIEAALPTHLPFVGGNAGETAVFKNTYQFYGDQVLQNTAVAVLFAGDFTFDMGVSHGSRPVGLTREVTRAEGSHIFEIDHRPAFEVFQEFLGPEVKELTNTAVSGVCLGVETPLEARQEYEDVALRIPRILDTSDNSFYIAGEWPTGTKLLVCRRDPETIIRRAGEIANKIKARNDNKEPKLVLHFNCAGRSQNLIGEETAKQEVAANQVFDKKVPWFGLYTFGEIAPVNGKNFFHNWTSVVLTIYED